MKKELIVRAWKDPAFRASLSAEERAALLRSLLLFTPHRSDRAQENSTPLEPAILSPPPVYGYVALGVQDSGDAVAVFDPKKRALVTNLGTGNGEGCVVASFRSAAFFIVGGETLNANVLYEVDTRAVPRVVASFPLGSGNFPEDIALSPDGGTIYLATLSGIMAFDRATGVLSTLFFDGSIGFVLTVDGKYLYLYDRATTMVRVLDIAKKALTAASIDLGTIPSMLAITPAGDRIYTANGRNDTVSVIDTSSNTILTTIPVSRAPVRLTVTPDGKRVYVACFDSSTVDVIDVATNTATGSIKLRSRPNCLAATPDNRFVYAALPFLGHVHEIDTVTNTVTAEVDLKAASRVDGIEAIAFGAPLASDHQVEALVALSGADRLWMSGPFGAGTLPVGTAPICVALAPDCRRAYVANHDSGDVSVIDLLTRTVLRTIPVGTGAGPRPVGIAVSPDSTTVYVANSGQDSLTVIDTRTFSTQDFAVGDTPVGVAVAADGEFVYVTNFFSGTVSVYDSTKKRVTGSIPVENLPFGVATDRSSGRVWVSNTGSGSVSVIDVKSGRVDTVPIGGLPLAIAIGPGGARAYVTNISSNTVSIIDNSLRVVDTVDVGQYPFSIAVDPDGLQVRVANPGSSSVSLINAISHHVDTQSFAGVPAGVTVGNLWRLITE
ncbi:mersacidin/lichenicidin family type 2 lantibiotic [Vitiosangium sp. GDMCC 1.1324]|uniref:mersacidin/lichenicidin family type 2 lantibiotic n=1 Tax=Vitiosangium sp. (strain GDMCC 1.1324) TaxID=2138576 RepID=UPI00130DFCE6|nr:mersacidin/lichenicidin family type 2 lantibiotic [Vitiosangium sp. GDMCC 1.1324]